MFLELLGQALDDVTIRCLSLAVCVAARTVKLYSQLPLGSTRPDSDNLPVRTNNDHAELRFVKYKPNVFKIKSLW